MRTKTWEGERIRIGHRAGLPRFLPWVSPRSKPLWDSEAA
jgi:hypothetical protein